MRSALIVGIDHYDHFSSLNGCVSDAYRVNRVLERHSDDTINFTSEILVGSGWTQKVSRNDLYDKVEALFSQSAAEVALFYFAGHGNIHQTGGVLLASDSQREKDGVSLADIVALANVSKVPNRVIVLDSCHSGIAGNLPGVTETAMLSEGVTILTASSKDQYAKEDEEGGVFTSLFVDALMGGAANLTGDVTPGSVYAHIDQSLGIWGQRPIFKTNVQQFISLRRCDRPIPIADLRKLKDFFPERGFEFPLDPTYEPELKGRFDGAPDPISEHTAIFAVLQKYNRLNLLVPVGAAHMWNAAMESKSCKLTVLGEHYRRLVVDGLI